MFVKVLGPDGTETLRDCDEIYRDSNAQYTVFGHKLGAKMLQFAEGQSEIFVMNDNGQTIDRYIYDTRAGQVSGK